MNLIERNHCVISGKEDLEPLYSFKNFPIYMGCVDQPMKNDLTTDMNWWISRGTGTIQLNPLIPLEELYREQHAGAVGKTWGDFYQEFAEFIGKYRCERIFEIGGAHGIIAKKYQSMVKESKWTMLEPNPKMAESEGINIIRGFFDEKFSLKEKIDAIVHSNLIEHMYEPDQFLKNVFNLLPMGGLHLFSIPEMRTMLERGHTNCINFEHTILLTESFIDYLLASNGFRILEKKYFKDGYSVFYATKKIEEKKRMRILSEYGTNKKIFNEFLKNHSNFVSEINQRMASHNGKVFLFGGHIFSQYLIGFGLNKTTIDCILDNDPSKQGKRLYGTPFTVNSTKILGDVKNAAVILRAGRYNEEIKNDIIGNINSETVFWE